MALEELAAMKKEKRVKKIKKSIDDITLNIKNKLKEHEFDLEDKENAKENNNILEQSIELSKKKKNLEKELEELQPSESSVK